MRNLIQVSNVIFFIGGGADKTRERFGIIKWGPTNLMGLTKTAFDLKKGYFSETKYYGYLDKSEIIQDIIEHKRRYPDIRIILVGHSRGGEVAIDICVNILPKYAIKTRLLICLDPVKAQRKLKYLMPDITWKQHIETMVCIYAKPKKRDPTDFVALLGGQYGERLQQLSDFFVEADINHGEPMPMLKTSINKNTFNAFDLLLKESQSA